MTEPEVRELLLAIAAKRGVNLEEYGAASPTKVFIESLIAVGEIMQLSKNVAITEQNPLTATTLKSKLGLAQLATINVVDILQASLGTVTIDPKGVSLTVPNRLQLESIDNLPYYIDMEHDVLTINQAVEFTVRQGEMTNITFIATGEKYQTFELDVNDLLDTKSVTVIINGIKQRLGRSVNESADFMLALNNTGKPVIISLRTLASGQSINVSFASCFGLGGDIVTKGMSMTSSALANLNPNNNAFEIAVNKPIIGGVSQDDLIQSISVEIAGASATNLIGNTAQLETYLARYKRYVMKVSEHRTDGLITVTVSRNIQSLSKEYGYWQAAYLAELYPETNTQDAAEFAALLMQMRRMEHLQLDKLVRLIATKVDPFTVEVTASMTLADYDSIVNAIAQYAIDNQSARLYEVADLYEIINNLPNVDECKVVFVPGSTEVDINEYGNALPSSKDRIAIITAVILNVSIDGGPIEQVQWQYVEEGDQAGFNYVFNFNL